MNATVHCTGLRLRAGDIIHLPTGQVCRVEYVNDCRARVRPVAKEHVELPDGRSFNVRGDSMNISPNSEVPILRRRKKSEVKDQRSELPRA